MSTVLEKIKNLLDENNVNYRLIEHEPVVTSEEAARIRDSDISMGAKALVFIGDGRPLLTVIPGDKKLDMKKFKTLYKIKDLAMADPGKLFELTGLEKGAVPPMGKVLGLPSYYDNIFLGKDIVAFNAGSKTVSVKMSASDLLSIENPILGDFAKD
jgi:Ala-tRNA(Pro) deacylase